MRASSPTSSEWVLGHLEGIASTYMLCKMDTERCPVAYRIQTNCARTVSGDTPHSEKIHIHPLYPVGSHHLDLCFDRITIVGSLITNHKTTYLILAPGRMFLRISLCGNYDGKR